ncbi:MAG: hypothetical protein RLZZ403_1402 [Pseudomonadota bacterium]|jgi:hypothetical protein
MQPSNLLPLRTAIAAWVVMGFFGIPALVFFDLFGGWRWPPYNAIYDQMIVSIYVAVGFCALRALRRPLQHTSFLWFVVWSSFAHGGVMLFHALHDPTHRGHLVGDVWILAGGLALAVTLRQAERETQGGNSG